MRLIYFSMMAAATMWYCGCSRSDAEEESGLHTPNRASLHEGDPLSVEFSYQSDKEFIAQCGYDTTNMVEYEDYYAVGEEFIFYKSYVWECRKGIQPKLEYSKKLRVDCQQIYLKESFFESSDREYMVDAAKAWNEIGQCNLRFYTRDDNIPSFGVGGWETTVHITPYSNYTALLTVLNPPLATQPATDIYINPEHAIWKTLSPGQKKYLVMHGLGHVIGLKDYTGSEPFSDGSIMLSESKLSENKNLWSGFSIFDVSDLRQLYPPIIVLDEPKFDITVSPEFAEGYENKLNIGTPYTFTADYTNPSVPNPVYVFSVEKLDNNIRYEFQTHGDNTCTLKITSPGVCRLNVKILKDGKEKNSYQIECSGYLNKFNAPSNPILGTFCDFKWEFWDRDYPNYDIIYWVEEDLFHQDLAEAVTMEHLEKGHVRIRFNDYGQYTVKAEIRLGSHDLIDSKEYSFTKIYKPRCQIVLDHSEQGPGYVLPDMATEATGENCLDHNVYNVVLNNSAPLEGRVAIRLTRNYMMHHFKSRKMDVRNFSLPTETRIYRKGEVVRDSILLCQMYHPDSLNYLYHTTMLYGRSIEYAYPPFAN